MCSPEPGGVPKIFISSSYCISCFPTSLASLLCCLLICNSIFIPIRALTSPLASFSTPGVIVFFPKESGFPLFIIEPRSSRIVATSFSISFQRRRRFRDFIFKILAVFLVFFVSWTLFLGTCVYFVPRCSASPIFIVPRKNLQRSFIFLFARFPNQLAPPPPRWCLTRREVSTF